MFRTPPAYLVVLAGVLNNTVESSEESKVVRKVTEVYLHEKTTHDTYSNDIAIIKVRLFSVFKKNTLHSC